MGLKKSARAWLKIQNLSPGPAMAPKVWPGAKKSARGEAVGAGGERVEYCGELPEIAVNGKFWRKKRLGL